MISDIVNVRTKPWQQGLAYLQRKIALCFISSSAVYARVSLTTEINCLRYPARFWTDCNIDPQDFAKSLIIVHIIIIILIVCHPSKFITHSLIVDIFFYYIIQIVGSLLSRSILKRQQCYNVLFQPGSLARSAQIFFLLSYLPRIMDKDGESWIHCQRYILQFILVLFRIFF